MQQQLNPLSYLGNFIPRALSQPSSQTRIERKSEPASAPEISLQNLLQIFAVQGSSFTSDKSPNPKPQQPTSWLIGSLSLSLLFVYLKIVPLRVLAAKKGCNINKMSPKKLAETFRKQITSTNKCQLFRSEKRESREQQQKKQVYPMKSSQTCGLQRLQQPRRESRIINWLLLLNFNLVEIKSFRRGVSPH